MRADIKQTKQCCSLWEWLFWDSTLNVGLQKYNKLHYDMHISKKANQLIARVSWYMYIIVFSYIVNVLLTYVNKEVFKPYIPPTTVTLDFCSTLPFSFDASQTYIPSSDCIVLVICKRDSVLEQIKKTLQWVKLLTKRWTFVWFQTRFANLSILSLSFLWH